MILSMNFVIKSKVSYFKITSDVTEFWRPKSTAPCNTNLRWNIWPCTASIFHNLFSVPWSQRWAPNLRQPFWKQKVLWRKMAFSSKELLVQLKVVIIYNNGQIIFWARRQIDWKTEHLKGQLLYLPFHAWL